ncbi:MAG: DUF3524 domain-containing protein [Actinomycetota bacterium]|nr:DUF3524 domain-containing protein [Actinomycetota bacterium]
MAQVLLVEPFHGGSHAAWAEGLAQHSRHEVVVVSHEADAWRWRLRGGALTLADDARAVVAEHGPPDVLLASSLFDLTGFLGLSRRFLGDPAVVRYLHESQILYPTSPNAKGPAGDEFPLVDWMSMAVADEVWVNSGFHRDALLAALPALLDRAPDRSHSDRLSEVVARCHVVPVGVDLADVPSPSRTGGDPVDGGDEPLVVWNQRWDHDKNPTAVFRALGRLADEGVPFRLAVLGENVRVDPREFTEARDRLGDRVVAWGFAERADYLAWLGRSDVVAGAADHEFFGISVVEAMAAGCVPVLPARQSYPWLLDGFAPLALYPHGELTNRLREVLVDLGAWRSRLAGLDAAVRRFDWRTVVDDYDDRIEGLVAATA